MDTETKKHRRLSTDYTGRDRRPSNDENHEITELFKSKMNLQNEVKKYLNLKIQYQLKKIEDEMSMRLVSDLIESIDIETSKIINKLNHKKD
jgi:uncharacterized protein YlxW (UPF0749 family)